jgi:hypothetical protein
MNKLFLYGLLGALVLSLGMLFACGSSSSSGDDDTTPVDDDTSPTAPTCQSVYDALYQDPPAGCGDALKDSTGADIPEASVVADCTSNSDGYGLTGTIALCIIDNPGNCTTIESCINAALNP